MIFIYNEISKLVLFRGIGEDSILFRLAGAFADFDRGDVPADVLVSRIYEQIKRLLEISTEFGFDENLWHNYLTYLLITDENPFTLTCEKLGAHDGSVNAFAKSDFRIFKRLFNYDFSKIEKALGIDCFTVVSSYKSISKKERMYNKNVSEKVRELSRKIEAANEDEMFEIITEFYRAWGVGIFGLNKAFRIIGEGSEPRLIPINNTDKVVLSDLVGCELQKQQLIANTRAFVEGRRANNVLLFGDSGTGKSTSIKAIENMYFDKGLRLIEIYKHQFQSLSAVISAVKNRNYKFIIYMDDLSFEEFEIEYKYLKAVIEGGIETKPDNVLIYATSNRRHLIRETWRDKSDISSDDELHHSDTVQEKLSLVNRFGISVCFTRPQPEEYYRIVLELAARYPQITLPEEEIRARARIWEMNHGGLSGRTAQQFVNYLAGTAEE